MGFFLKVYTMRFLKVFFVATHYPFCTGGGGATPW
jgi:hypothetical protein